jgi:hypothetical protein
MAYDGKGYEEMVKELKTIITMYLLILLKMQ